MSRAFQISDIGINSIVPTECESLMGKLFLYYQDKLMLYGAGTINHADNLINLQCDCYTKIFNETIQECLKFKFITMNTLRYNMISGFCKPLRNISVAMDYDETQVRCSFIPIISNGSICKISVDI